MKPIKKKSLFDHINQITKVQNPNDWDEISKEDKKLKQAGLHVVGSSPAGNL